jgi:sporulation protein YlmC with PRC-barrel domain
MNKRIFLAALAALTLTAAAPVITFAASPAPVVMATDAMRASTLIGMKVYDEKGVSFGTLDDLVFTNDGKEPSAILSVGSYLGVSKKLISVPLSHVHLGAKPMMAGATKEFLTAQPDFLYNRGGQS